MQACTEMYASTYTMNTYPSMTNFSGQFLSNSYDVTKRPRCATGNFSHFEVTADGGIEHMVHIKLAKVRPAIPPPHT